MTVRRLLGSHALAACAMAAPWPGLLVAVWDATGSQGALALVGAARMAPYVACSSLAGVLADRIDRGRLVRLSGWGRALLLAGCALALATEAPLLAAGLATAAVTVGTPAYPATAAGLPRLAGAGTASATHLLVTIEVGAFVVGPALGGAALTALPPAAVATVASVATVAAALMLRGIRLPAPAHGRETGEVAGPGGPGGTGSTGATGARGGVRHCVAVLGRTPRAAAAVLGVAAVNAMLGALGVALLPLSEQAWPGQPDAFGTTTGALGAGALAAPVVVRLLALGGDGVRRPLVLTALALPAVALAPSVVEALLPLALVGACAVHVEAVATLTVQRCVPDHSRGSVLGLTDAVMVASALVGAAVTPFLAVWFGADRLVLVLAAALTVAAWPAGRVEGVGGPRVLGASRAPRSVPPRTVASVEQVF